MVLNCIFLKNTCLGVGDIFCTLGRIHLSICSLGANCFEASPPEGRPRINCFAECPTRSGRNWTEHYMCGVPTFKVSLSQSLLGLGETSGIISRLFQLLDYVFPYLKLTLFLKQHLI